MTTGQNIGGNKEGDTPNQAQQRVLMVGQLVIRDWNIFQQYDRAVRPLMEQYGGETLGFSAGSPEPVEGNWRPSSVVVQQWPDRAAFLEFFHSPAYQPLARLRHEAADSELVLFDKLQR
jgi:uncharacterized protein (DUF1330 family)